MHKSYIIKATQGGNVFYPYTVFDGDDNSEFMQGTLSEIVATLFIGMSKQEEREIALSVLRRGRSFVIPCFCTYTIF